MAMNDNYQFEKGDWVHGKAREGELIHGFIETVDSTQGIVKVMVVKSDNENVIGKGIWILNKSAEKIPAMNSTNENELLSLIDLALLTKDEQWFRELSTKLSSIKKTPDDKRNKTSFLIHGNRAKYFDKSL